MGLANIMVCIILWLNAFSIGWLALQALRRSDPVYFFGKKAVKPEELTDIKAYNRANGIMWAVYADGFFSAGIAALFNSVAASIFAVIWCFSGGLVLVIAHKKIYNKYKQKDLL